VRGDLTLEAVRTHGISRPTGRRIDWNRRAPGDHVSRERL